MITRVDTGLRLIGYRRVGSWSIGSQNDNQGRYWIETSNILM